MLEDTRIQVALIGATFMLLGLFVRQIWDWLRHRDGERAQDRQMVRGLYAEIVFNTVDLERFIESSISLADLQVSLERAEQENRGPKRPHITDARHTRFYDSFLSRLPRLPGDALPQVVVFYHGLEKLKVQIDGVQAESYVEISVPGRVAVIERIIGTALETAAHGRKALDALEMHAPEGWKLSEIRRTTISDDDGIGS